jgi:hypothetical protein
MSLNLNLSKPLAIAGVIVAAIVGLTLLAAFLPSLFSATSSITENVTTADTGNDSANTILGVFAFIVPLAIVFGIVGIILTVASLRGK